MRLTYISNARLPTEKAHGIQIIKMCEAFASANAKVELIHPFRVQTKKMREVKDIWKYYDVEKTFEIKTLPSLDLGLLFKFLPESWEKIWFFTQSISYAVIAFLWLLFNNLKREDIIYSRDQFSLFLILLFKRFIRAKVFFEAHTFPESKRKMAIFLFKRLDGLIVITQKLKELYVSEGMPQEKILVAPDGVDLKMFDKDMSKEEARRKLNLPQRSEIIGYVGQLHTMEMEKGVKELIKAFKIPKEQMDNLMLCFVGGPEEKIQEYVEFKKRDELRGNIIFVGQTPPFEIPIYMKAFDVCVMPFPWSQHYAYYMSPLKLFEYMASKRPIVASDLPSIKEILRNEKNAILVEPDNPQALAEEIKRVLMDKELADGISEQAFKDVQKYTWYKRAERILDFILTN